MNTPPNNVMSRTGDEAMQTSMPPAADTAIGKILLDAGKLQAQDVENILRMTKANGMRFGEAAMKLKLVSQADIEEALAIQFSYSFLRAGEGGFASELIAAYHPFTQQVEGLRALRSQLILRWFADQGHKALAIVSPQSGEGRSYLAANLAVVFSQLGEHTLLIDADLRAPRQHGIFNIQNQTGLSSLLAGRAGRDIIQRIPHFQDLSILPAGPQPPNPLELLSRDEFSNLLETLSGEYEVIIIDTPAGNANSDAQTIASNCGGALMLTRRKKTRLCMAQVLAERLTGVGVEIVGTVFNSA